MPASHAHVPTDRASRYLTQLCKHTDQMSNRELHHGDGGTAPIPRHADRSDRDAVIDFGSGRCVLHATDEALLLRAEADDQPQLHRIQNAVTARLQLIGRRDRLTVTWQQAPPEARSSEGRDDPA